MWYTVHTQHVDQSMHDSPYLLRTLLHRQQCPKCTAVHVYISVTLQALFHSLAINVQCPNQNARKPYSTDNSAPMYGLYILISAILSLDPTFQLNCQCLDFKSKTKCQKAVLHRQQCPNVWPSYISAILSLDPVFQINNNLSMSNTLLANFKQSKNKKAVLQRENLHSHSVSFQAFCKKYSYNSLAVNQHEEITWCRLPDANPMLTRC